VSAAIAPTWQLSALVRGRTSTSAAGAGGSLPAPLVAILCTAPVARVAAAGVALALARATGQPCALAGAVGADAGTALGGLLAARRAAAALQRRGLPASASGRLTWLSDRRGPLVPGDVVGHTGAATDVLALDVPARCAVLSAELGRSAAVLGLSAAVAVPFARTEALDRVLAWHDAIVVVREADAPTAMVERALTSLAALGRPVAAMTPPARLAGALGVAGLAVPAEAWSAVGELARDGFGRPGPRDA
jgi:hypothetical protein